ncbi:MAG: hypothetical protein GF387_02830 [Candidatus Portnoybacteria bacterium]|nr:hypothetical protein [Candidatus Portnoybacteria bacterium]
MINKTKKLKIFLLTGITSFIIPKIVFAGWFGPGWIVELSKGVLKSSAVGLGRSILTAITEIFLHIVSFLVQLSSFLFEGALKISFSKNLYIIEAGWEVTRDIANMLFILFLVIIAFGTILRVENYQAKKLLPKLILIALLINFSMVFAYVVVDFTNITASFFIKDIKVGPLVDSLKMVNVFLPMECSDMELDEEAQSKCESYVESQGLTNFWGFILSMMFGTIFLLILSFVLLAGTALLLVRTIFIWFLVILAPMAFICYILPGLRKNWQQWLSTFLRWCIFAPAYAFFLWLTIKVAIEGKARMLTKTHSPDFMGAGTMGALTESPAMLLHYIIIIGMLIGSLIAASKFGIYGSNTLMKVSKKVGKWGLRKASRKPADIAARGVGSAMQRVGQSKLFGGEDTRRGRALITRGKQIYQTPAMTEEAKRFRKRMNQLTDEGKVKAFKQASGGLAMVGAMESLDALKKSEDREAINKGVAVLRANNKIKAAKDLEELRFDAIGDKDKAIKAITKGIEKGINKSYKAESFKDQQGQIAARRFVESLEDISEVIDKTKEMPKATRKAEAEAIKQEFTDFSEEDIKRRASFYAATGKLLEAFEDQSGNINESEMKKFANKLRPKDFANIDMNAIPEIAVSITDQGLARDMGKELSAKQKLEFASNFQSDIRNALKDDKNWKSYIS